MNNGITTTNNGTVTVNESGHATLAVAGDIISDGAVSLTAAGGISTAGDVTTSNDNVTYVSATTLTGPVAVNTGSGSGNIAFNSTVDGGQNLTLTAGTGNVTFADAVGGASRLGDLQITSAADVTAKAISASTLTQAAGTGTTTLNGVVNTNAAGGVSLTGTNLVVNNGITTTNNGTVTVNESGRATLAAVGDITSDGAVSLTAAGGISTAGDVTTSNDNVAMITTNAGGNIDLGGNISAGTGAVNLVSSGVIVESSQVGVRSTTGLTATSRGGQSFVGSNAVTRYAASNSDSGDVTLNNQIGLQMNGISNGAVNGAVTVVNSAGVSTLKDINTVNGNITLTNTGGNSALGANISAGTGVISLNSSGRIAQNAGGVQTASSFRTTSTGGQTLNGDNTVSSFSSNNNGGGTVALTDTNNNLTIANIKQTAGGDIIVVNKGDVTVNNSTYNDTIHTGSGTITLATNGSGGINGGGIKGTNVVLNASTIGGNSNPYITTDHLTLTTSAVLPSGVSADVKGTDIIPVIVNNGPGLRFYKGHEVSGSVDVSTALNTITSAISYGFDQHQIDNMLMLASFEEFFTVVPKTAILQEEDQVQSVSGQEIVRVHSENGSSFQQIQPKRK